MRTDRLAAVADQLGTIIETTPLPTDELPPTVRTIVGIARMAGLDPEALVRSTVAASVRSLPSRASADPERADAIAAWLAGLLAWLRGETDEPPDELVL